MKRIALVTGAGRGIGLEICRQLAAAGFDTILTARDANAGREAAAALDGGVVFMPLDVTDPDAAGRVAAEISDTRGRLDVLVHNAGVSDDPGGVLETDLSKLRRMMEVNFYGPLLLTRALAPLLLRSDDARVINVTSGMGRLEKMEGNHAGYRLSKAALNALTVLMARELDTGNVTVNAVSPGNVRTDMGGPGARLSVAEGAANVVWLATAERVSVTGRYFSGPDEVPW